jgi:hypothetical protein
MEKQRRRGTERSWGRRGLRLLMAAGAMFAAAELIAVSPAFANAANPNNDTAGTFTVNGDGTVTVNLSGTWSWPGQTCEGRYGEGWAVDWWGVSSSQTPTNPFSLTNASIVTYTAANGGSSSTTTGTISPAGAIQIKGTNEYFHVPQYYDGEVINPGSCTDTGSGPTAGSQGNWSATATYPNQADIPQDVCVIMYDEHGTEGRIAGASNFDPTKDGDNSIQTNSFDPTQGAGYCVHLVPSTPTPVGTIGGIGLAAIVGGVGGFFLWRNRRSTVAIGSSKGA